MAIDRLRREAVEVWRDEGVPGLWFRLLARTVYRRVFLLERSTDIPVPPRACGEVVIEVLEGDGLARFGSGLEGASEDEIYRRRECGHVCFAAFEQGRLIAYLWAGVSDVRNSYLDHWMPTAPDALYSYDGFVDPERRVRGIVSDLTVTMISYAHARGYRRVLSDVVPDLRRKFRHHQRGRLTLDYQIVGMVVRVQVGPWRRYFHHRRAPGP